MSNVICPKCGAVAKGGSGFGRYSKPYCTVCGWNLEEAKERELRNLKRLPIALLWTAGVIGAMGYFYGAMTQFIVYGFICAVCLAIVALLSWRRWKSMQIPGSAAAIPRPLVSATPSRYAASPLAGYPSTPASEAAAKSRVAYDRLLRLPKPRRTRFKTDQVAVSITFVVIALTFLIVAAVTTSKSSADTDTRHSTSNLPLVAIMCLGFLVYAGITIKELIRDRNLLANGDVALALITRQRISGGYRQTKISYIEFEFKDLAGRMITGKDRDDSRKLYEDMQTPVFYNPENPSENVVLTNANATLLDI